MRQISIVNPKQKTVYCIAGAILSLRSTLSLVKDVLSNTDISTILSGRFNQDHVENLFVLLQAMGGNNNNPSVSKISKLLVKVISSNLLEYSPTSHCETDEDEMLHINLEDKESLCSNEVSKPIDEYYNEDSNMYEIFEGLLTEDYFDGYTRIESASSRYFSGYILY